MIFGRAVAGAAPGQRASANERTSAAVLSDHELEALDGMSPQQQAELLLERAVNHFSGAVEQISERAERWRGHIRDTPRLEFLFSTAVNSDELAVRAAAIEVNLAARNLERSAVSVDRLEPIARSGEAGLRVNALWNLGLLGNRGIEPDRIADILLAAIRDESEHVRYWAVEALAHLGSDAVVEPLLDVFRHDRSPVIRERAACGLAQSGMLNQVQRRTAVPRLLDYAGDYGLDPQTRMWAFQALRDITGKSLGPDAEVWKAWWAAQR